MQQLVLLTADESALRIEKARSAMREAGAQAMLIGDNANIYYFTGRVVAGYVYIPAEGMPLYFVRRPVGLTGDGTIYIRKPEQMAESIGLNSPSSLALELDNLSYSAIERLRGVFPAAGVVNASAIMRSVRSVKTPAEVDMIRRSGVSQMRVYARVPRLYHEGMTDLELQVEIERASRLEGCLGQFRISGNSMELYMGSILVGRNADTPTPYDFAMGGEGLDPSLPVGCNGTIIREGESVMVDVNGNYTGYMTDMTRTYSPGGLSDEAVRAHRCSIDICHALAKAGVPGTPAKQLYEIAEEMARENDLADYFMGHRQKAGFVGHGVGIEVNEAPVLAPRSRDILAAGQVIAIEPKFVIPSAGAVGIENTYVVTANGLDCLTPAPEEIISLV